MKGGFYNKTNKQDPYCHICFNLLLDLNQIIYF